MATALQDFSSSTSLTDNFTQSSPATGTFDWVNNVGLDGSPGISVSLGSDQVWTAKQGYTISENGTYSVSAFFQSSGNNGFGALGFSTQSQDSNAGNYGAPAGTHIGIFFHGGGGGFLSNGPIDNSGAATANATSITWNNGGILSNGSWYKAVFTVDAQGSDKFDLNIKVYNATAAGVVGSLVTEHSLTDDMGNQTRVGPAVTNASVSGASTLHTFFSAAGSRMSAIDNFVIDLGGDALLLTPGPPVVDLNGSGDTVNNEAPFNEIVGPDDGSAAVSFTSGASNIGDLYSPNLNNLKISIPTSSIESGDQLVVDGASIDITGTSDTAEVFFSGAYFDYVIADNSGTRTITFTSLS